MTTDSPPITESTIEKIQQRLTLLSPEILEVIDESAAHRGHVGAQLGGGHFCVRLKSDVFAGKSLLQSHQMVYQALGEMMRHEIHALKIHIL